MAKKSAPPKAPDVSLPRASATELRGRQSIRVAFKLTHRCIEAMNILGSHLRLKPKSLFDHMVQEPDTLQVIAARAQALDLEDKPRTAKTYVVSRDAAEVLDAVARSSNVARDAIVEASVEHLMPLIQKEQIRHTSRKDLAQKMAHHLDDGRQLLGEMVGDLGNHDPMCDQMRNVMAAYERAYATLTAFIHKGDNIEGFDTDG